MHITLESDYAVRIVDCLVQAGARLDARTIAERTDVTLRFSLKILRKLVSAGIVKSFKGTQGGYELARALNEMSLGDVIEAVEGEYAISRCTKEGFTCNREHSAPCKFQKIYREISREVQDKLKSVTFDQLV
ncbi:MAG: RrF2 family transcriptional regulator [Oscillospiraceae bacterium]